MCGIAGGIGDTIEGNPFSDISSTGTLIELQRGFFADVEGLPLQHGLLLGLRHRDGGASGSDALNRSRSTRRCADDLKSAEDLSGQIIVAGGQSIENIARGNGSRSACRILHRRHGLKGHGVAR